MWVGHNAFPQIGRYIRCLQKPKLTAFSNGWFVSLKLKAFFQTKRWFIITSVEGRGYVFTCVTVSVCLFVSPSARLLKSCERILMKVLAQETIDQILVAIQITIRIQEF